MTTLDIQIAAANLGLQESSGGDVTAGTNRRLNTGLPWNGFRFLNVTVPAGATIDVCYLELYGDHPALTEYSGTADFVAEDDAGAWSLGVTFDISGRTLTGNGVAVDMTLSTSGFTQTPSLVDALQAVIDRGGWASGQAVAIVVEHDGSADGAQWSSYDDNAALAPKLHIEYTAGGPSAVTVQASPGVVSVSGPAATVVATTTISAGVGVVAVSGPAASVQIGSAVTVEASAGVVSVSGPAATIVAPIVVAASPGVADISGLTASIVAPTTIGAGVGVVSVAGQAAAVVATTTVAAAAATLQLVGNQATVVSGAVSVQASAGVVLVSGPRATIVTARYVYDVEVQDAALYTIELQDVGVYAVKLGDEAIYTVELSDASRA